MMRLLAVASLVACADALNVVARASAPIMMAKKVAKGKEVQVILGADIDGLGLKGTVVSVKPAYAENVIRRQNLGMVATPADLERIAKEQAEAAEIAAALKKKAEEVRDAVQSKYGKSGMTIEVQMKDGKVGEEITSATVADLLKRAAGVTVAPDDINVPEITELGSVVAQLNLHPDVTSSLKVVIEKSKITFS